MRPNKNNTQEHEPDLKKAVEALESRMIYENLQKMHWHRGKTAELLNIPRRTLQRKMVKYGFRKIEEQVEI